MEKIRPSMFKIGNIFQITVDGSDKNGLIIDIMATEKGYRYTFLTDQPVFRSEEILESQLNRAGAKMFGHINISKVLHGRRDNAIWFMADFERDESDEEEDDDKDIDAQCDIYQLTDNLYTAELKVSKLSKCVAEMSLQLDDIRSERKKLIDEINALKEENKDLRKDNRELEVHHNSWKRGWIEAFEAMGWCGSCNCNHDYDICPEGDDRK